jgi:hypothetical protein
MHRHAQVWQHVNGMDNDSLQKHIAIMDYALPIQGALAHDPKVTAKDVIKAWSNGVADGHIQPSQAVAAISAMPADPEKLRPWLRQRYADNLSSVVHAKAALLQQAQAQAQPQGQPVPAPVAAPGPLSAPGGPMR